MNNKKVDVDKLLKLFKNNSSRDAIKNALLDIMPKKNDKKLFQVIFLIMCIAISSMISFRDDTVTVLYGIVSDINAVVLTIFGIVFTGYTLFQALISNELLMRMIEETEECSENEKCNDKTKFQESNDYFMNVMMVDIIAIVSNIVLMIILKAIPEYYCLFNENLYNEILCIVLLFSYFAFQFRVLIEVKSFIFNIYQLFNIAACEKILKILKDEKHEK